MKSIKTATKNLVILLTIIQQRNDQSFSITELSISELFSALRNEVHAILLFVQGVPLSRWSSERDYDNKNKIEESVLKNIQEQTLKGFDELFGKKIEIIETHTPSSDKGYIDVYSSLVFLYPWLKTQDAILLCSAIFEKTNYFITTDTHLVKLNTKLKEQYKLEVVKPETALRHLKNSGG